MSSNLIYSPSATRVLNSIQPNKHSAIDRTPYCYLVGWTDQNLWYYGRRTAKGCHPNEFWKKYFTSSSKSHTFPNVSNCRLEYGEPDHIEIRHIFYSVYECSEWESRLLHKINAASNKSFLNRTNGDLGFDSTNKVTVRTPNGDVMQVDISDDRYISGEYVSIVKDTVIMFDLDLGKNVVVSKHDPKINRTMVHPCRNKLPVTNDVGETIYVSDTDIRYISGEYKHILQRGIQLVSPDGEMRVYDRTLEVNLKSYKRNLEGTVFCKDSSENIIKVSTDEYHSRKDLVSLNSNKVAVVDISGDSYLVTRESYYANKGTLFKTASTDTIPVKDKHGNCMRVHHTDERYINGELKHISTNMTTAKHSVTGVVTKISLDDPRLISGEYVKYSYSKEKHTARIEYIRMLSSRPEVAEIRKLAETLDIKLPMNWDKRKDLSPIRSIVYNHPMNMQSIGIS